MIAGFLELEDRVKRRFREESVSDIIVAALLQVGSDHIKVVTPYEPTHGSDFDIVVVDPATRDAIQFRIQAKRLHAHATNWQMGSYRELAHPSGTGAQASTLIRSAAHEKIPTVPLYAFYNPESVCLASAGALSGVEMASGFAVHAIIQSLVKAKPQRPPLKRVSSLMHLFFPLSALLCGPSSRRFPTPAEVRTSVAEAIGSVDDALASLPFSTSDAELDQKSDRNARTKLIERMTPARELTAVVEAAIEAPKSTIRAQIRRPKFVLLSRDG